MRATHVTDQQMKLLLISGGVLLAGGVIYVHWQAGRAVQAISTGAKKAAEGINPVNEENIFNRGFNGVFQAVTGRENQTFGTLMADLLNPPEKYMNTTIERGGL